MKQLEYHLDAIQVGWIFAPLRNKLNVIDLLMRTVKLMIINEKFEPELISGEIILCVSKMSRLFYLSGDKYFSITFPFTVIVDDDECTKFYSKNGIEIDSKISSDVISILSSKIAFNSNEVMEFAEPISDIEEYSSGFWSLFREILLFDDGYLRYDHDQGRENGKLHPMNHLDIFYSTKSTFKLGLNKRINNNHLMDLLNIESDCHFLDTV